MADSLFNMEEDKDVQLMLAYAQGNERAFHTLYEKYKRPLFSWIYRMVPKEAVAEELAQEVFLRVYRARYTYRPKAKFKTWLYTIAAHLAFNELRHNKNFVEGEVHHGNEEGDPMINIPSQTPSQIEQMEAQQLIKMINQLLAQVGERQKAALLFRYFEDLSHEEIGKILNMKVGAVKSLLHRGLETLEVLLRKKGREI